MTHLFLDTNVIIDFLSDRKPFSDAAATIFNLGERGKVKLYISSLSYNNIYYVLKKESNHRNMIKILKEIESMSETADVSKSIVHAALNSDFQNFEDAIQYFTALSNKKISAIVSRDPKGYKKSELPVLNPEEAIGLIESAG